MVDYNGVVLYPLSGTATSFQVDTWLASGMYTLSSSSLKTVYFDNAADTASTAITVKRRIAGESSTEQIIFNDNLDSGNSYQTVMQLPFNSCDEIKIYVNSSTVACTQYDITGGTQGTTWTYVPCGMSSTVSLYLAPNQSRNGICAADFFGMQKTGNGNSGNTSDCDLGGSGGFTMQGKGAGFSGNCGSSYGPSTSYETGWIPIAQACWGYQLS